MLDVAAHMLLLQRQALLKREQPEDGSFLPLSLSLACLLRQLPSGLAPPPGMLSFHQLDRLPMEAIDQKLARLVDLDREASDEDWMEAQHRVWNLMRALALYAKVVRSVLRRCQDHLSNHQTAKEAMQSVTDDVVALLTPTEDEEDDEDVKFEEQGNLPPHQDGKSSSRSAKPRRKRTKDKKDLAVRDSIGPDRSQTTPQETETMAIDPSGIMKRALARDVGDGSSILAIMKKYPSDERIQSHGVRALKSIIRRLPPASTVHQPNQSRTSFDEDEDEDDDDDDDEDDMPPQQESVDVPRQEIIHVVIACMQKHPASVSLQRDALFCLSEYVHQADSHVMITTAVGGIVSIMDAMARLPDDEDAQIAALSVLGHPRISDASVVRVNPESRRLVLSAMKRFPLSERLQGLACLALTNLSLRHDESMEEIVAKGGLILVVSAMTRFRDESLVQASGSWLLGTVSARNEEMLQTCLDAGALPVCEKARVRFPKDAAVQTHVTLAIESLVREVSTQPSLVSPRSTGDCVLQ
ncbi:hypothetical protein Poli38472_014183 [Pythium oligandrum]|uniref:Uncharacterized protein n=1 Tax=Pythium oligandrum TaxID=41045 RepID=A0A8K1FIP9_PYTOL|nr:hypothetical protein Poli38472_014183 [Pythium oligandrum]|eukprot:TMW64066.1 hypothetical protein Poli38472_014183 [Pythium oligandrum]